MEQTITASVSTTPFLKSKKFLQGLSLFIGIFFVVSGYGKAINTGAFGYLIVGYGLPFLFMLAPVIAGLEVILGLVMIFQMVPKRTAFISMILLGIFTLMFAYGHFIHDAKDCGCFGELDALKTPPAVSFLRNFILIGICAWVYVHYPKEEFRFQKWKINTLLVVGVLVFTIAGITFANPLFPKTPAQNTPVKESAIANYIKPSKDSTYMLFVFNYTCTHCWDATENVKKYQELGLVDKIIAYGVGDEASKKAYYAKFKPNFEATTLPLDEIVKLTDRIPSAYIIQNDSIKYMMRETINSPYTFLKNSGFKQTHKHEATSMTR